MSSKTKETLVSAFLELVQHEDTEKITVTDLVEQCDISRQTFYYHFNDIHEMLAWSIEKDTALLCRTIAREEESDFDYAAFFEKYEAFIKKSIHSDDFLFAYNLIYQSFRNYLEAYLRAKNGIDFTQRKYADFLLSFSAGGFTSMILNNIQNDENNYHEILENIFSSFHGISKN